MSLQTKIDSLLRQACASGDVPGVVAMATDRKGTIYQGRTEGMEGQGLETGSGWCLDGPHR